MDRVHTVMGQYAAAQRNRPGGSPLLRGHFCKSMLPLTRPETVAVTWPDTVTVGLAPVASVAPDTVGRMVI